MDPDLQQFPNMFGGGLVPPLHPVDRQLFDAVQAGDAPHVQELLAAGAAPDDVVDGGGRTALSLAAQQVGACGYSNQT